MEEHGPGGRNAQPGVDPRGHSHQAAVFGQSVEGVEHLDGDQDSEGQSGGLDLQGKRNGN